MDKKEFALSQIAPYIKDPTLCGYNKDGHKCMNITPEGKMCVAGKNLLPYIREQYPASGLADILNEYENDQKQVLIPEAVDILTVGEWSFLQNLHDYFASEGVIREATFNPNSNCLTPVFTREELDEYVKNMP